MIFSIRGRIIVRNHDSSSAVIETSDGVGYEVYLAPSTLRALSSYGETILYISESTSLYGSGGAATLYGFESVVDREIFELLRSMPSTGAKKALEYFEKIKRAPSDFKNAIISRDTAKLATLFGFRKPTAEKFIANIRDKIIEMDLSSASSGKIVIKSGSDDRRGEEKTDSRRTPGIRRRIDDGAGDMKEKTFSDGKEYPEGGAVSVTAEVFSEAIEVLVALGYREQDARVAIDVALESLAARNGGKDKISLDGGEINVETLVKAALKKF